MANDRTFALMTKLSLNDDEFKKGIDSVKSNVKNLVTGVDGATGSVGEMKKALRTLNSVSFAGKSQEEILALNTQIGKLKDEFGDLKAVQKGLGTEFGNVAVKGIQGLAGLAEAGMGVAMVFGMDKKSAQELQGKMLGLIGAVQGIAQFQEMLGDKTLQVIAIRIKETAVTVAQTVATKVATATQWLLNASLTSTIAVVGLIVIGVAAFAAGLYYLYGWLTKTNQAEKDQVERLKAVSEQTKLTNDSLKNSYSDTRTEYTKQEIAIDKLVKKAKDEHIGLGERKKALNELIQLDPTYLKGLTLENIAYDEGVTKIMNYKKALYELADAKAVESTYIKLKSQYIENEIAIQQKQADISKGITDRENAALTNNTKAYSNLIDQVGYYDAATGNESGTGEFNKDLKELTKTQYATAISLGYLNNMMNNVKAPDVKFNTDKATTDKPKDKKSPFENIKLPFNDTKDDYVDFWFFIDKGSKKNFEDRKKVNEDIEAEDQANLDKQADAYSDYYTKKYQIETKGALKSQKLDRAEKQRKAELFGQYADQALQLTNIISSFQEAAMNSELNAAGNNEAKKDEIRKKYAEKQKEMSIVQALINGAVGVTKAFADGGILGFITGGLVLAATLAQIAVISSAKFARGGVIPGSKYSGDNVPVWADSGERILTANQNKSFEALALNVSTGNNINGGKVYFESRIRGTDIILVQQNTNKKTRNTR
jgi:hypothetical protein